MCERPAPYTVGNVVYLYFRTVGLRLDGGESDRREYRAETREPDQRSELRTLLDDFYARIHSGEADELEHVIPKIILGYTKELQDAEDYDAALIAYRLANTELMFAVLHRHAPTDLCRTMIQEALIRYDQLIEYAGSSVVAVEDLDLVQMIPFKAHLNSAVALGLLGAYDDAWEHLESAEQKVYSLLTDKQEKIRGKILEAIGSTRQVIGDMT